MKIRTQILRTGCIAALLAIALALPSPPIAAKGKVAAPVRPYGGSCSAVVTVLTSPGVFPQQLRIDLDCTLRHLGRTTGVAMQTVSLAGPPIGTILQVSILNETTYQAANGDLLFQDFAGSGEIDLATGDVTFEGTETFAGGTGRFVNAIGSAEAEGSASIFTNLGFYTTKGTLAY